MKGLEQIRADESELAESKREQCRHENADHLKAGEWLNQRDSDGDEYPQHIVTVEQFRCLDCGAWLSLGPAAPADPVELAAARLAAGYHDCNDTDDDLAEPLVRHLIDYSLGERKLWTERQQQAWALFADAIDGVPEQDGEEP